MTLHILAFCIKVLSWLTWPQSSSHTSKKDAKGVHQALKSDAKGSWPSDHMWRVGSENVLIAATCHQAQAHPTSRTWSNHPSQPMHYALLLPISMLIPHHEGGPANALQNNDCLQPWLHNGGTRSPLTSGQHKLYTTVQTVALETVFLTSVAIFGLLSTWLKGT